MLGFGAMVEQEFVERREGHLHIGGTGLQGTKMAARVWELVKHRKPNGQGRISMLV